MSQKVSLFDKSDSSDDETEELKINKEYANKYDQWREKELLQRYKDLQEEVSSSSSESEEEDDPQFDESFFRLLSLLKGNDPKILDKDFVAFPDNPSETKSKKKKEKPLTVKDYEMQMVLKSDKSRNEEEKVVPDKKSINENELAKLKSALMESDSDEEDCIKSNDVASMASGDKETEGFIKYLKGENVDIPDDSKNDLNYLRQCWNDPNLDEDEKFLRDFFLNKEYKKKDPEVNIIEEIEKLSDEEKFENEQEQFEHKYNFRFEEPDPEFIKRYPRTVGDSLRRKDPRRKLKREDYAERKQREKEQKREELKRLKALKRKEIENKFFKLQEVIGKDDLNFDENDIESDFDPDKHDRKMNELFNDDYYSVNEEHKPVFEYDEEIDDEDWDYWTREENQSTSQRNNAPVIEQNNSDDDVDEQKIDSRKQFEQEMLESTQERKVKKKSLFAKILSNPKPLYDPEGKSFDEYLEEYYRMDYEDVIADMPVRYKYRKVIPNDFGLTVDEILKADDKDLNRWCSVKKTCQYRQEDEEKYDVQAFKKKAAIPALKEKFLPSLYSDSKEEDIKDNTSVDTNSEKKKKKKHKVQSEEKVKKEPLDSNDEQDSEFKELQKKKKKKVQSEGDAEVKLELPELYNESLQNNAPESMHQNIHNSSLENTSKRKKKRSRKKRAANTSIQTEIKEGEIIEQDNNAFAQSKDSNNQEAVTPNKRKRKRSRKNRNKEENDQGDKTIFNNSAADYIPISNTDHTSHTDFNAKQNRTHINLKNKKMKLEDDIYTAESKTQSDCTNVESNNSLNNRTSFHQRHKNKKFKGNYSNNKEKFQRYFPTPKKEQDIRLTMSNERLSAYGINPKKFKNKIIYGKQNDNV